jgi:hypothetical protein
MSFRYNDKGSAIFFSQRMLDEADFKMLVEPP